MSGIFRARALTAPLVGLFLLVAGQTVAASGTATTLQTASAPTDVPALPATTALQTAEGCIEHRAEARYRVGYDHLVHLRNLCNRRAECTIKTNVNPYPLHVTVNARSTKTVLTFRGSPARSFTATVECTMQN